MGTAAGMILAAALLLLPAPVLAGPAPDAVPRGLWWKNAAVIGGIGITVGIYGANGWWEDGFSGAFRTTDEGWFGQNTYAGGADKALAPLV
ncbi:MAG: hypothetical protein AAB578_07445, partial [Elusimicrobiota bacterium]